MAPTYPGNTPGEWGWIEIQPQTIGLFVAREVLASFNAGAGGLAFFVGKRDQAAFFKIATRAERGFGHIFGHELFEARNAAAV